MTPASTLTPKPRIRRTDVSNNQNGHANHRSAPRATIALTSPATAFGVFILGAGAETSLISLLQPSEGELTWIGDLVLAITLGVVLYLWLNLRFARAALLELERDRIVV